MKKLNLPQVEALRYAKGRQLYAADINDGNGNLRRTLLSLLKHGLLGWDPIYHSRVVLTDLGKQKLAAALHDKRMRDRPGILHVRDVGDRRIITLHGVHREEKP